jgi:DamX protein
MKEDPLFTERSTRSVNDGVDIEEPSTSEQVLEDYRQRYGLAADPFGADPYFPFFTGGQRRELLDQIIHICQFGQAIPLVSGERGVGKTRLLLAIYEALGQDSACVINALPTMQQDLLARQVAHHFGLPLLANTFENFFREVIASDLGPRFILIDNAQDLDDQTLSALMSLNVDQEAEGNELRFVLFGDLSLVARVQQFLSSSSVIELYIERFSLRETVDYLNYRMEMADYLGPEIFTETNVEPWWRKAQGQLPMIHRLAQEHLLETVLPPLKSGQKPFPVIHIMAIAILGGVGLMTFLYSGGKDEPDRTQSIPISIEPPVVVPVPQEPPQESLGEAQQVATPEPAATADLAVIDTPSAPAMQTPSSSVASVEPEPLAVAPTVAKRPSSHVSSSTPAVAAAATGTRTYARDEETLLSWQPTDFTLQLLGVSTEKAAKDFIADQANRDDLLLFRTARQGKPWFVVVAGRYASAAEARSAISALPAEQVKAGPWSRGLKGIQEEIQR